MVIDVDDVLLFQIEQAGRDMSALDDKDGIVVTIDFRVTRTFARPEDVDRSAAPDRA